MMFCDDLTAQTSGRVQHDKKFTNKSWGKTINLFYKIFNLIVILITNESLCVINKK